MHHRTLVILALFLAGCSSSTPNSGTPPTAAESMQSYLKAGVTLVMPRLGGAGGVMPFALNSGSPGSAGVQLDPDPASGAPPNSYVFTVNLDGDGNGTDETVFTGSAVFNGDPAFAGDGFGGHVILDMQTAGGLGALTGELDFVLTPVGGEISGTGTFTEVITGNATTCTVDPGSPLVIHMALGTSVSVANACGSSLQGDLQLDVLGPTGSMSSTWGFVNTRSTCEVSDASFIDNSDDTTHFPDELVTIPCGQNGSLDDWNGTYLQDWACLPQEFGEASLTLTATYADTIEIQDEDPPGSGDFSVYYATMIPGNAHVLRGYFVAGAPGNTYREDFTWILSADGSSYSQISCYTYLEGPLIGSGGMCGGSANRIP